MRLNGAIIWTSKLMTPWAPLSKDESSLSRRSSKEILRLLERLDREMPEKEALRLMAKTGILAHRQLPLQGGVRRAWTSGELRRGLAEWLGLPPPSKATVLRALDHLCAHGLLRREWRGRRKGRPVYRFVRPWRDDDVVDLPGRRRPWWFRERD